MKLNFFRNLLFIFCLITIFSLMSACGGKEAPAPDPKPEQVSTSAVPRETPIPGKIGAADASPTTNADGLRPVDQKIIGQLASPASGDKIKDAFSKESYKVNLNVLHHIY